MPEREQEALEPAATHPLIDRAQPLAGALTALGGPERIIALQRAAGNAAVVRMLARTLSPPPAPGAQLPTMLAQLDPAVQAVLHRRGRTRVDRPHGGWVVREASDERIDFDWVALLFILHRANAASGGADYLTVLERLIIPAIQLAARDPKGWTPPNLPNMDVLTAAMWVRQPPPYVLSDARWSGRYRQVIARERVEELLTTSATRARQANITDLSIPGRRDQDYAFIMGPDEGRGARNQFYRTAGEYYRGLLTRAHVQHVGGLEEVLDWIRHRAAGFRRAGHDVPPLGTVYIVSHANELGQLMTRMTRRGKHGFYPFELEAALGPQGNKWWDDRGREQTERLKPLGADDGVDGWTRIFIRGCDLGKEARGLNAMRAAFGGQPLVHAPRLAQYYGPMQTSGRSSVGEGLADTYSLVIPAAERVNDDEAARRLATAYGGIDVATFRTWLRLGRAGRDMTHSVSDYTVPWSWSYEYNSASDVPRERAEQEAIIRQQIVADPERSRLVNFDQASWTFRRSGRTLTGTGLVRYLHLHVTRRDAGGRLQQFGVRDREAYGIDVRPLAPTQTTVPWP